MLRQSLKPLLRAGQTLPDEFATKRPEQVRFEEKRIEGGMFLFYVLSAEAPCHENERAMVISAHEENSITRIRFTFCFDAECDKCPHAPVHQY